MKSNRCKSIVLLAALLVAFMAVAAPGGPIGGIIVKGGKNPGGQLRVLATSDAQGGFRFRLAEAGAYRLEFARQAGSTASARAATDLRLEYRVRAAGGTPAASWSAPASPRTAVFGGALDRAQVLVDVPAGGAEITGAFGPVGRSIQENGLHGQATTPTVKGKGKARP